jgi:hypothetical protein
VSRTLLVEGEKTFKIDIPDDAKITFGPFAPPQSASKYGDSHERSRGTLRIYQGTKDNIIGCFSPVSSFREITAINYSEQVAKEEGAVIWKSDAEGYQREEKVKRATEWQPDVVALPAGKKRK